MRNDPTFKSIVGNVCLCVFERSNVQINNTFIQSAAVREQPHAPVKPLSYLSATQM